MTWIIPLIITILALVWYKWMNPNPTASKADHYIAIESAIVAGGLALISWILWFIISAL
jgi:hypothetical protein